MGWAAKKRTGRPAGGAGQHPQDRNAEEVSAPARVAARRGGPKGERRPPHRRGEKQTTRSGRRSLGPISAARRNSEPARAGSPINAPAAPRQKNGALARRDAGGRRGGEPSARQGRCAKGVAPRIEASARPPPVRQGEKRERQRVSTKTPRPQERKARERARPKPVPLISTARQRRPAMLIVTRTVRDPARGSVGAQRR